MDVLCGEGDFRTALTNLMEEGCDRLLFAGCSPRSSLKFPEERIAAVLQGLGLHEEYFEVANIREQSAWQHPDYEAATAKAADLVRMAHARLKTAEPAPSPVPIVRKALVVGGGAAGLQTSKDLAAAGIEVTLAERNPWLGGRLCRLHKIFQSESWPSVCDGSCVGPVQAREAVIGSGIELLTSTDVTGVELENGGFTVTFQSKPAHVDPDLCISCHKCAEVCPEETDRRHGLGPDRRKAIDKEFERALPDVYSILPEICTMCGDCVPACPTDAIDLKAEGRLFTREYGAVFLATGSEAMEPPDYTEYRASFPDVVTSLEFERIIDGGLSRPSDGEEPEQVVFVQCAGSRAGPERSAEGVGYCSKTCCSITIKQVDRLLKSHPFVEPFVVYYKDIRTYERASEEQYQQLRIAGVEFISGELEDIRKDENGGLVLSVERLPEDEEDDEPDGAEPETIDLEAGLVVLAAAQTPSEGSSELYRLFGVEVDRYGYPIENQPRLFRPTESLVDRVYVIGASSGPKVIQQASEQGSAAAMRSLPALLRGSSETSKFAGRVNPELCIKCRICETVCPHGAMKMTPDGAVSDPAFCQSCGFCGAACPINAAELTNFTGEQILDQAKVAFEGLAPGEPKILALLCYWCSYSAADFAGIERSTAPANYRAIRIRCSSSVNTGLLMQMFRMGVDGILVAGCPEKSCHHLWGNFIADKRIEIAKNLMNQLGLDPARLRFEYIGAPMQAELLETLRKMDEKLRTLGPNPALAASGGRHGR